MKAILVLGTGRSGTSALAGCLQILGGFCGNNLREENAQNEKGYFEDKNITALNNYILNVLVKTPWYDSKIHLSMVRMVTPTKEILGLIKYAIHTAYGKNPIIVIKDPRLSLLLFCYQQALIQLGYEIYYVYAQRAESEKSQSLLHGFPELLEEDAQKMVEHYTIILEKNMASLCPHYTNIQFNHLICKTYVVIYRLKLYLPFLNYEEQNTKKIYGFLDPTLKHF